MRIAAEEIASECTIRPMRTACRVAGPETLLRGSWDLVTMVINKVTILITGYKPS